MKQGITITREYDHHDRPVVRILKRRGKLTLEEVSDLPPHRGMGRVERLLRHRPQLFRGNARRRRPLRLRGRRATPSTSARSTSVTARLRANDPAISILPQLWSELEGDGRHRRESVSPLCGRRRSGRSAKPSLTPEARVAWYWSYIGAVDMAHQLEFITDARRLELYDEVKRLKPVEEGGRHTYD